MRSRAASRLIRTPYRRVPRWGPRRFFRLWPPTAQVEVTIQPPPQPETMEPGQPQLQPIPSGKFYRVVSPVEEAMVTPSLANELGKALERFAQSNGFSPERPMSVSFKRGTLGLHRFRRAADIYAVGGKGIGRWAREWNQAMRKANAATNPQERARLVEEEKRRNLGYKLYKALQSHGGWARPPGFPVQLFGPWTRGEGPHKTISDRLLHAHRDHIHVAR